MTKPIIIDFKDNDKKEKILKAELKKRGKTREDIINILVVPGVKKIYYFADDDEPEPPKEPVASNEEPPKETDKPEEAPDISWGRDKLNIWADEHGINSSEYRNKGDLMEAIVVKFPELYKEE